MVHRRKECGEMNYSLAICESIPRDMTIDIGKDGNEYYVSLWDKSELKGASRKFDTIEKAFELFILMSKYFVYGLYSANDRFEIFDNWKGENNNA